MKKIKSTLILATILMTMFLVTSIAQAGDSSDSQEVNKRLTNTGDNPCPASGKDCMSTIVVTPSTE